MLINKKSLNFLVIIILSFVTFVWTFFIFHMPIDYSVIVGVVVVRMISSRFILNDYSLSWSKASQKTFLIKSSVYIVSFLIYMPILYSRVGFSFLLSELFLYLFTINFLIYIYYYYTNKSHIEKTKRVIIYGAGRAGIKIESEFEDSEYRVEYFLDDDKIIQNRSIDSTKVISSDDFKKISKMQKYDLLIIAMPSAHRGRAKKIYEELNEYFLHIQILPSLDDILKEKDFTQQLKEISVEDLLARHPKDLDKQKIEKFIKDKTILVTGAGGSIGSEICRQSERFGASKLILLDHSEYNLYSILEELHSIETIPVMQSVTDLKLLDETFSKHRPDIVIHAAAYKHVPLVEANMHEGVYNNIIGTKNCIDMAIKYSVSKFVLISTDKAVRPTNVMGATKRVCELYAQNIPPQETEIVAVRFGNVLGSSGSVIPKFKAQIASGEDITVTHPDITRYFMLIPEACELVLQSGAIGRGGEIFILDMGEPIKIVDLARKMIELSGRDDIDIKFTGLRAGEKLYEELLIDSSDTYTEYDSITVALPTIYGIDILIEDINRLLTSDDLVSDIKRIVPEFDHKR